MIPSSRLIGAQRWGREADLRAETDAPSPSPLPQGDSESAALSRADSPPCRAGLSWEHPPPELPCFWGARDGGASLCISQKRCAFFCSGQGCPYWHKLVNLDKPGSTLSKARTWAVLSKQSQRSTVPSHYPASPPRAGGWGRVMSASLTCQRAPCNHLHIACFEAGSEAETFL